MISRRLFIQSAAVAVGFGGLRRGVQAGSTVIDSDGLIPDPAGILDLPPGYSYQVISRWGDEMDDGLRVPGRHDGMAAFPGPDGLTILMRNHEVLVEHSTTLGAFGDSYERLGKIDRSRLYDAGHGEPLLGGVTTLVYDTRQKRLQRHFMALAGTAYNCAGGPTPWGTWLSCEEWHANTDRRCEKDHGYVFEVAVSPEPSLTPATPLPALGRFRHEAVAADPRTGVFYLTEDIDDGLLYRFIPDEKANLRAGGRLQALAVRERKQADLRNWLDEQKRPIGEKIGVGTVLKVEWIDLHDVDTPADDLRLRGFADGAARFARAEGIWFGRGAVYFACTTGGSARLGQIWRYTPSPMEGSAEEIAALGTLELFIEPNNGRLISNADNITLAPNGDLYVCEDGSGRDHMVVVSPEGAIRRFAANRLNTDEFCGATFSPDGSTLFVNTQNQGLTFAIHGPWAWTRAS